MKTVKIKIVLACILSAMLMLASCTQEKEAPKRPAGTPDSAAVSEPAATEALTAAPTAVPTQKPTEPPTQPFSAVVIDDVQSDPYDVYDASGFVAVSDVIPDVRTDIRYYSDYNFVGTRIDGYEEPLAILSKEAARALNDAADELRREGFGLVIYDAYRPQRAVDHFVSWANDWSDTKMKAEFYPDLDKSVLFDYGYIAYRSGHSRGSTVDLSLYDLNTGEELDMGGPFDYFSEVSHPGYGGVSDEQFHNRMLLRDAMTVNGFEPLSTEWWHFTLCYEPYPSTYFDFPVSRASLGGAMSDAA